MEGCVGYDKKDFPYLLMLLKLWNGDWEDQLERMNNKVDEDNGRVGNQDNGGFGRFRGFQGTNSGRTLGVLFQNLSLAFGGPEYGRRIKI